MQLVEYTRCALRSEFLFKGLHIKFFKKIVPFEGYLNSQQQAVKFICFDWILLQCIQCIFYPV